MRGEWCRIHHLDSNTTSVAGVRLSPVPSSCKQRLARFLLPILNTRSHCELHSSANHQFSLSINHMAIGRTLSFRLISNATTRHAPSNSATPTAAIHLCHPAIERSSRTTKGEEEYKGKKRTRLFGLKTPSWKFCKAVPSKKDPPLQRVCFAINCSATMCRFLG